MKVSCPACGHYDSLVKDGATEDGQVYVRRRLCTGCHRNFFTEERVRKIAAGQDIEAD